MDKDDGGRAFPSANELKFDGPMGEFGTSGHAGMTLRDYFAVRAMQAALAQGCHDSTATELWIAACARMAYVAADALLAARGKAI